uniref:G-protein coupled receptors family 1 profile domain-containing protein n=1 Tax=Haplochromis burtoni TaxID=8153 RepID=A0A3Q2UUQ1_HAPBU
SCLSRQLHSHTNILLLSLAAADFLNGLLFMPGEILRNTACWFLGQLTCSLYNYVSYIIASASVGNMVLISVDRYVAICDPLHYPTRITEGKVKLCVCLCWLCSVLYSYVILIDDLSQPGKHKSCYGKCIIFIEFIAGFVDLFISFIIPLTVIIVLYMRVFVVAVSQARAMRSQVTTVTLQLSVTLTATKSELKAARTLGVLVLVFLLCFCPYYIVSLFGDEVLNSASESIAFYFFLLNSCLNPLIYAMFYPWFRKAVKL